VRFTSTQPQSLKENDRSLARGTGAAQAAGGRGSKLTRMVALRRASRVALALTILLAGGCAHGSQRSAADKARIGHSETHDVDEFLRRIDRDGVVRSYHIEDERLVVTVDADGWQRMDPARQDALKRSLWDAWAASYRRYNGNTGARIFLSVEDGAANDLGSYFAR
jgi:hypothetical protein